MKTSSSWMWLAVGVMLPYVNGCTQQTAGNAPSYRVTNSTPPPVLTQTVTVASTEFQPPAPASEQTNAEPVVATAPPLILTGAPTNAAPPIESEPIYPPNLRVSQAMNEVIRLAQAGVDESVILTYVTNSTATFLLGAEEIVYLHDIGVPGSVVTAMMQRDQMLRTAYANAAGAAPVVQTNEPAVAVAPSYVNAPQSTAAPTEVVSEDYFDETLSPYGTWIEVEGYGRCWRPTVAVTVSTWQPYVDRGRWIYTDAGWYWLSDYSWGSVAFHYGRWFNHPRWGWCWWPDRVWAPSWVTWRYDDDYCGWAPLPPNSIYTPGIGFTYFGRSVGWSFDFGLHYGSFVFVPWNRFCDPYPYRHRLAYNYCEPIFNRSVVINNVALGNNRIVHNRGIPKERVVERARQDIRTVNLREERIRPGNIRPERLERDGSTLVVSRPIMTPPSATSVSGNGILRPGRGTMPGRNEPVRSGVTVTPPPTKSSPAPDRVDRDRAGRGRGSAGGSEVGRNSRPNDGEKSATPATKTPIAPAPTKPGVVNRPQSPAVTTPTAPARPAPTTPRSRSETMPTPVRTPTPIFNKPVVVERSPAYTPSTRVIGGLPQGSTINSTPARPTSTWSSPTSQSPAPRPMPNLNNSPAPVTLNNSPAPVTLNNSPAPVTLNNSLAPITRSRSVETAPRAVGPTPVVTPSPTPNPAPSFNRSASEVPRSSVPRVERSERNSYNRPAAGTVVSPTPRVSTPTPSTPTVSPRPSITPRTTVAPRSESGATRSAPPARAERPSGNSDAGGRRR